MVGIAYSGCDRFLALLCFTIAITFNGAVGAGYQLNRNFLNKLVCSLSWFKKTNFCFLDIDISPNHAGLLQGICNSVANLSGVGAPYLAGVITSKSVSLYLEHQNSIK